MCDERCSGCPAETEEEEEILFDWFFSDDWARVSAEVDGVCLRVMLGYPSLSSFGHTKVDVNWSALGDRSPKIARAYAALLTAAATQASQIEREEDDDHPSRLRLWQHLRRLKQEKYPTLQVPRHWEDFSDEVFGKRAFIFFSFDSMETRRGVEDELAKVGFEVDRKYCSIEGNCDEDSPRTMIRVAYFKGWHWDE